MSNELWIGLGAAIGATVLFGTVFVPVKKVAAGDGKQQTKSYANFLNVIAPHFKK
ncbi:unnamed protein product [Strongylus vulgaris]|uniref:Uncharacterized protein n=1 Tax=Strongylus vulgaris TaxID=40348 RepID=A0A3P7JV87_STRVU|nr:unnamed protein product [Strongylus vulgaris]